MGGTECIKGVSRANAIVTWLIIYPAGSHGIPSFHVKVVTTVNLTVS